MATHIGNLLNLALSGTFVNGLWLGRNTTPTPQPTPYGTYVAYGPLDYFLDGKSAMQQSSVQIDLWGTTYAALDTLADAVEAVMDAQSLYASPTMFTSTQLRREYAPPDPDTTLKRIVLEFSLWFKP